MTHPSTAGAARLVVGRYGEDIGGPYRTIAAYREALEAEGLRVRLVGLAASPGPGPGEVTNEGLLDVRWWHLGSVARFVRRLGEGPRHELEVVFGVWHLPFVLSGVRAVLRRPTCRRVLVPTASLSSYDWGKHRVVKSLIAPLVYFLVRRFDVVLFATVGESAAARPAVGDRAKVVHEPIAPADVAEQVPWPGMNLACLGRVAPEKDLPLAFRSLARLQGGTLHVIGDGDATYVSEVQRVAEHLGLEGRVVWHGWLPREEALATVARCSCLLVTSITESYGHAAIEAMSLGVPVVMVDRVAPATEFAAAGLVLLAEPTDHGVASAVATALECGSTREGLVARGRKFAAARSGAEGRRELARAILGLRPEGDAS